MAEHWAGAVGRQHSLGRADSWSHDRCNGPGGLGRASSAVDMRQLTSALLDAREGTGEVRATLLRAAFKPRLPGLTKLVSKLSKEGAWRKALEVFEAVEEMGVNPDTALTNAAISACDKGGRWQKALEIFESMARSRLPRDAITYSAVISALAKGKQWHAALMTFDHMQAAHIEADVVTCCSLINALERGGQWQLAEKLFMQMCTVQGDEVPGSLLALPPQGGSPVTPAGKLARAQTSPSSVLDALNSPPARAGGLPQLMSIAESPRAQGQGGGAPDHAWGPLSASFGILSATAAGRQDVLGGLGQAASGQGGQGADVEQLSGRFAAAVALERGNSSGGAPADASADPFAAAAHLVSSLRGGTPTSSSHASFAIPENEEAAAPLEPASPAHPPGLRRLGSGPGTMGNGGGGGGCAASPQRPSSGLGRSGSLKRELGIPELEAAQSLRRAMSCYPELSGGDGQGQGLSTIFNFSHAARVTPNRVCCNALLSAYARAKPPQFLRALHLLGAMWEGGPTLTPDAVSYNTALKACANAFQVGRALEVYRDMRARGVAPSVTTFNTLLAAASDAGSYPALLEVGQALAGAEPDVKACCMNAYVAGLVKVGRWDEALAAFQGMLGPCSAARPSASTFNTIMTVHMKAGQVDQVRAVFDEMTATGLTPSIVSHNVLLASLAARGAWAEALEALTHVLAAQPEGVNPNTATFNAVLSALAKGAPTIQPHQAPFAASRALQVFSQMQGTPGCAPDASTYASLIQALAAMSQHAQAVAVHDMMLSCGLTPDAPTAALVLAAALQAGRPEKAFALAQSLQVQGVQLDPEVQAQLLHTCVAAGAWDLALQLCSAALLAQGSTAAPLFNFVLHSAAGARQFGAVVQALTAMRAAGLEVDPGVAAQVMGAQASPAASPAADAGAFQLPPTPPPAGGSEPGRMERALSELSSLSAPLPRPPAYAAAAALSASPSDAGSATATPPPAPPSPGARAGGASTPFCLGDANALLESFKERLDVDGAMEVLHSMREVGVHPDQASQALACYTSLLELMVRAGQPQLAVQLCAEAHEAGALRCFALPSLDAAPPQPGTGLGNALDLRGCSVEVGMTALLTWLARCRQLAGAQGLAVRDRHVNIVLGGPASEALREELLTALTSGASSLPAFQRLIPTRLDPTDVSTSDANHIYVSTAALFGALERA